MNNHSFLNQIFFEPEGSVYANEEASFLDISELFGESLNEPSGTRFFLQESQPLFEEQHQNVPQRDQIETFVDQKQKNPKLQNAYKSSYNKNVCFNICQKTIKVIRKGTYVKKLSQLCKKFNMDEESFKYQINKHKRDFTGPKALAHYASIQEAENQIFVAFMKWFLAQKYLRIALNEGEMKDVKAYIQYKNLVILPLLE